MTKHHTKISTACLAQGQQGPTNADWPGPPWDCSLRMLLRNRVTLLLFPQLPLSQVSESPPLINCFTPPTIPC